MQQVPTAPYCGEKFTCWVTTFSLYIKTFKIWFLIMLHLSLKPLWIYFAITQIILVACFDQTCKGVFRPTFWHKLSLFMYIFGMFQHHQNTAEFQWAWGHLLLLAIIGFLLFDHFCFWLYLQGLRWQADALKFHCKTDTTSQF